MPTMAEMIRNYAKLPLWCLGFHEKPRQLFVSADVQSVCADFMPILAEEAYKMGSELVDIQYDDSRVLEAKFLYAIEENKLRLPGHVKASAMEALENDAAILGVRSYEESSDKIDPKYPISYKGLISEAREPLTSKIMASVHPWNLIYVPSAPWAKKMGVGVEELWRMLFTITGADREDPLAYYKTVVETLSRRRAKLNALEISALHFQGPSTDLYVGLSEAALWQGGAKKIDDAPVFTANWPTYEVFTTPDWRRTNGHVSVTKPVVVGGKVVNGLQLSFKDGRIVGCSAHEGLEAYQALISTDAGAAQLGEVALVGLDSPIQKFNRVFYSILIDENCACHIATGRGYTSTLRNGATATKEDLKRLGCNQSKTHTDVMISDARTNVDALSKKGSVPLLRNGRWMREYL